MKKIFSAALGIGLLVATAVPAMAANISVGNTGSQSRVSARDWRVNNTMFRLNNTTMVTQSNTASYATGGNAADRNTHDAMSIAGNVTTNGSSTIDQNNADLDIDASGNGTCSNCTDSSIAVNWTGFNSTVNATVMDVKNVMFEVNNTGNVANNNSVTVTTGGNSASDNTGNATAMGGDVNVSNSVMTKINNIKLKVRM